MWNDQNLILRKKFERQIHMVEFIQRNWKQLRSKKSKSFTLFCHVFMIILYRYKHFFPLESAVTMSPTCEFIVFAPKYTQLHACGYTHAHTLFQTHSHNDTTRANVPTHTCTNRPEAYTSAHSNVIDLNDNTVIAKFVRNTHTHMYASLRMAGSSFAEYSVLSLCRLNSLCVCVRMILCSVSTRSIIMKMLLSINSSVCLFTHSHLWENSSTAATQ